jgi:hypothetical protein
MGFAFLSIFPITKFTNAKGFKLNICFQQQYVNLLKNNRLRFINSHSFTTRLAR